MSVKKLVSPRQSTLRPTRGRAGVSVRAAPAAGAPWRLSRSWVYIALLHAGRGRSPSAGGARGGPFLRHPAATAERRRPGGHMLPAGGRETVELRLSRG